MKLIIAGGRHFVDYDFAKKIIEKTCDELYIWLIIGGGARGADAIGKRYAEEYDIPFDEFPAEWDKYGKSAGYRRNAEMADEATALLAFWDGKSRGTQHMINIAMTKGLTVRVVRY